MIPKDFITEWRAHAPWVADRQVEQDLVISRALVAIFSVGALADSLAFRGGTDLERIIHAFQRYMEAEGARVTRAMFEMNLAEKLSDPRFTADIGPLLAPGHAWRIEDAARRVGEAIVSRLPGEPWRGPAGRS